MTPDQFDQLIARIAEQTEANSSLKEQVSLQNKKLDKLFDELLVGFPETNRVGKIKDHEDRIKALEKRPKLTEDELQIIRKSLDVLGSWRWMGALLAGLVGFLFLALQFVERVVSLWTNG